MGSSTKVTLTKISRKTGRALFNKLWPESDYPPVGTDYNIVFLGDVAVGWVATQYKCRRPGKKAHVVVHGLYVEPEARGQNLQLVIREEAVRQYRPKGSGVKLDVLTYVSACNIASMRNIIQSGSLPYDSFTQGTTTFIKFQGTITC